MCTITSIVHKLNVCVWGGGGGWEYIICSVTKMTTSVDGQLLQDEFSNVIVMFLSAVNTSSVAVNIHVHITLIQVL